MSYTIQPVHSLESGKGGSGAALPKVSSSDNGKALVVKNGKWAAAKLSSPKLAKVATSGSYKDLKNVPDLSNFVSSSEVTNMINNAVGDITSFDTQVVQELPAEGVKGTIYFLVNPDSQESSNAAEEYIWVNDAWEKIGDTAIDLSPYVTWNNIGAAAESNDYNDLDNLPNIPVVPIALSEFTNDAGFITADDVPKNVSELNNDAGYATEAYIDQAIDNIDIPEIPENISEFNNDAEYMTANDISITNTIDASGDGYRNIRIASINNHDITFPGHVMVHCGDIKDNNDNITYAKLVKSLSNYTDGSVSANYQIPTYSDEIVHPKQVVTKEYVDNAISDIPEVSYDKVVDRPTKLSQFENDAKYIPKAEYDKVVKALDALVAEQGKGARSANGEFYETAMEAVAAAESNVPMEVALTKDEPEGDAFVLKTADGDVDKIITFDLNGHEYAAARADGSAGTQTQAIHLEKGNTVVIKGGTLSALASNPNLKMMIQNYSDLVLEDMEIDCSDNRAITYVVSNNFGSCTIRNCHIAAHPDRVAVDCWFGLNGQGLYDDGVHVIIENSRIDGDIEYGVQAAALNRPGNERWWE